MILLSTVSRVSSKALATKSVSRRALETFIWQSLSLGTTSTSQARKQKICRIHIISLGNAQSCLFPYFGTQGSRFICAESAFQEPGMSISIIVFVILRFYYVWFSQRGILQGRWCLQLCYWTIGMVFMLSTPARRNGMTQIRISWRGWYVRGDALKS